MKRKSQKNAQETIRQELADLRVKISECAGEHHPLVQLLDFAQSSEDPEQLEIAKYAYQRTSSRFQRSVENGWKIEAEDEGQVTALKLLGFENWHDDEGNEICVNFQRTVIDDNEPFNPDVRIAIVRGTPKAIVIKILREAIKKVSTDWEAMLRGQFSSDMH